MKTDPSSGVHCHVVGQPVTVLYMAAMLVRSELSFVRVHLPALLGLGRSCHSHLTLHSKQQPAHIQQTSLAEWMQYRPILLL